LSSTDARGIPEAGPLERLSATGDNLANVIQYLSESHPERLDEILRTLSERVPRLEKVTAEPMPDGRLLLRVKDAPFRDPFLARFASDGTLKMLAYLVLLYDPDPLSLLGIEEPENYLHPRLLYGLAEECRKVSAATQVFVSTHSPFFVNAVRPKELWALERGGDGYTRAVRASEMPHVTEFAEEGAQLGALWMEGHLSAGDPIRNGRVDQVVRS
jgi:predicted ATPase